MAILLLFCLFIIRRHTLPYHFEHTFTVSSPEFIGSALALSNPVLVSGNKITRLQNGDEYFPAMLDAIHKAQKTINFEAFIFSSDDIGRPISRRSMRTRAQRSAGAHSPGRNRIGLAAE